MRDTHGMDCLEHAQLMAVLAMSAVKGGASCESLLCTGGLGIAQESAPQEACTTSACVGAPSGSKPAMVLRVMCALTGWPLCEVVAEWDWSAIDVKMQIELELGIPCRIQHLLVGSNLLHDEEPVSHISSTQPAEQQWTIHLLKEVVGAVHVVYMSEDQHEVSGEARKMLIDWLVKMHNKYRFHIETLFLTVSLLDRYFAQEVAPLKSLKLVGITALHLVARNVESHYPSLNDFVRLCGIDCTPNQLHIAECSMLAAVEFRLFSPTVIHFLKYFEIGLSNECWGHIWFTNYLAELSLHETVMLRYSPSNIAAAARFLSSDILGPWPNNGTNDCWKIQSATDDCISDLRSLMKMFSSTGYQMSRNKLMLFLTKEQSDAIVHAGA